MRPVFSSSILSVIFGLSACTASNITPPSAATPPDAVTQAAALLAAVSNPALNTKMRAPLLAKLDQLNIQAMTDSEDDPLPRWREEAAAKGLTPPPVRGRALGPAYRSGWLEPGKTLSLEQLFLAGQTAQISLSSPQRGPLALMVSDRDEKAICRQDGPPPGRCQWMALFTQRYRISLSNPGTERRRYFLVTN